MLRHQLTLLVAVSATTLIPAAGVHAAGDTADAVRDLAGDATELVSEERSLVATVATTDFPDDRALLDQLRAVDDRGAALLARFRRLDVALSQAIEAALAPLPPPDSGLDAPPLVVYDAAIADLERIAADPAAVTPGAGDGSSSTLGLLIVAALALVALGAAALGNTLRRRPDDGELEAMAWSDALTGLANRRRLDQDVAAATAAGATTAVIMVDVDHFKAVNDSYGHSTGDTVLRRVAAMLSGQVRRDDVVYRYGGEEFCVLLPGATTQDAERIAERIVAAAREIDLPDGSHLTVSVGVAICDAGGIDETIVAADRALYAAKEQGRDRAVASDDHIVV